jgi:outer membrane lipoprotein-sorting protein
MLIAVCVIFNGCTGIRPKRDYDEVSRMLIRLKDYTCDVKMRVTNNRSTMEYRLRHYYKSPDKYKAEVLSPTELEGQVTIFNGSSSYIYHPRIDQYLVTEDFSGSVEYNSFIGSFINHIKKSEGVKVSSEKEGEKELFTLEFGMPEPSKYMSIEKLWLDPEAIVPVKAEIYGSDGKTNVEIYYYNFVCNPGLKDGDFEITHNIQ